MLEQVNQVGNALKVPASKLVLGRPGRLRTPTPASAPTRPSACVHILRPQWRHCHPLRNPRDLCRGTPAHPPLLRTAGSPAPHLHCIHWWEEYTARHQRLHRQSTPARQQEPRPTSPLRVVVACFSSRHHHDLRSSSTPPPSTSPPLFHTHGFDSRPPTGQMERSQMSSASTTAAVPSSGCKPTRILQVCVQHLPSTNGMSDDMNIPRHHHRRRRETFRVRLSKNLRPPLAMASGKLTRSEVHGFGEEEFQPWLQGATL